MRWGLNTLNRSVNSLKRKRTYRHCHSDGRSINQLINVSGINC
jgi:hypothetical protein